MSVHELPELRDRSRVFRGRADAGRVLAGMLGAFRGGDARVLGVPAGGIPVAAEIARGLSLRLDVAVVSKITPTWNTEVGYGAVAFDGTVRLNEPMVRRLGLGETEIREGVEATLRKVRRRVELLVGGAGPVDVGGVPAVLVDDGLASGFTLRTAVDALKRGGASRIVIAVPTGARHSVLDLASEVDDLYCANVRGGWSFAVADAYEQWRDVSEDEAVEILARRP